MNSIELLMQDLKPEDCSQHNQPIQSYNKFNKPLCYQCLLELSGMVSVEKIKQQLQLIIRNVNSDFDAQKQVLHSLFDLLVDHKNKMIASIAKFDQIIQIVMNEINNVDSQKKSFVSICKSKKNQQQLISELQKEAVNSKEKHKQFRSQFIQQLEDFQQKINKIDHIYKLINQKQTLKSQKVLSSDKESEQKNQTTKLENINRLEYQLQYSPIKQNDHCLAFAFNKENSILVVGCEGIIKVYEFNNGSITEVQRLIKHTDNVNCLYFMKQTNSFISGSSDNQIIIWQFDKNNQWIVKQTLNDHKETINCLLMNKIEDLLISGSDDKQVKFWRKKQNLWTCVQSIELDDSVYAISLNDMENKLISCGFSSNIKFMDLKNDKSWVLVQQIDADNYGNRLSFTIGDQFVFQPEGKDYLEIYDYVVSEKQFQKLSKIQVQISDGCFFYFPCQYIKALNLLLVKHGKYINIFRINKNSQYQLIQTLEHETSQLFGRTTDDGQYLVTWNDESKEIQIRKLKNLV